MSVVSAKSKKGKANGFLLFLLDYKRENNLDMNEAQMRAGEAWMRMTAEERQPYVSKSDKPDASLPFSGPKLYTSFGVSFDELDRQKENEKKRVLEMDLTIEEILQTAVEEDKLQSVTLYFFSTSFFTHTLKGDIYPAELAMSKFNLEQGVYDTFGMMINPGELPMGMASDAKDHANKTHRRELPPDCDGETDFKNIYASIISFFGNDYKPGRGRPPPVFVEPGMKDEDLKAAQAVLKMLALSNGKDEKFFRVYPIENLLFRIYKKCIDNRMGTTQKPICSVVMARDMMNRDPFQYSDIGCDFHKICDANVACCLAKVKRWGYMLSKFCLDDETDTKIAGRHFPFKDEALSGDDVQSSIGRESGSYWNTDMSESFHSLQIGPGSSTSSLRVMSLEGAASGSEDEASLDNASYAKSISTSSSVQSVPSLRNIQPVRSHSQIVSAHKSDRRN